MAYITVELLSRSLSQGQTSTPIVDDLRGEATTVCESASKQVDDYCGRRFTPAETGVRRFSPPDRTVFDLPRFQDLVTLTAVDIDTDGDGVMDDTIAVDSVLLEPLNAAAEGKPCTRLALLGGLTFPPARGGLQLTGTWGWPGDVPEVVVSATLIQAARLWSRRRSPDGFAATGAAGEVYRISRYTDPDVCGLLDGGDVVRKRSKVAAVSMGGPG